MPGRATRAAAVTSRGVTDDAGQGPLGPDAVPADLEGDGEQP